MRAKNAVFYACVGMRPDGVRLNGGEPGAEAPRTSSRDLAVRTRVDGRDAAYHADGARESRRGYVTGEP